MCSWVFRKEHLALQEVSGILKRFDEEKRVWDKDCGRRPHDMFLPNGSKILVSSYVHLRREGLEGYISDFNNMVKDIWGYTKDFGIEVLPFVPVIFEGVDAMGGELLAGMRNWIEWMADQKERESLRELGKTGGEEVSWGRTSRIIYRPSFMSVSRKAVEGERSERWQNRGNRIDFVRGERKEVELRHLVPSVSIGKILKEKGKREEEDDEEKIRRESFERGVSIEAEFAFVSAIGKFTKAAIKEGSYTGRPVGNVREQLANRAQVEDKEQGKKNVFVVGGSQMERVTRKIELLGREVAEVVRVCRIRGEWTREKIEAVKEELVLSDEVPDSIVIGGPSNSLIRNGGTSRRGYAPEKRIVVKGGGSEGTVTQEFHLKEPSKLTMLERSGLVRQVEDFVAFCESTFPDTKLFYVEMTPRHVDLCCKDRAHMGEDDVWVLDNQRREIDLELRRRLGERVGYVSWHESSGLEKEPELSQIRKMGVVCEDGVHLAEKFCRSIAVNLCYRVAEADVMLVREGVKRRRL